jgi:hypothetical protein
MIKESTAEQHDLTITGADLAGLQSIAAQVTYGSGEVNRCPFGVHYIASEGDDYDFFGCIGDVRFVDNERNLDTWSLPVPDPGDPSRWIDDSCPEHEGPICAAVSWD